jgi:hypothetical protein
VEQTVAVEHTEAKPAKSEGPSKEFESLVAVVSELLFVLLPIVVTTMILAYRRNGVGILGSAEWSFSASVLFGQAIVKLVVRMTQIRLRSSDLVGLIVASGIVLGLCPALVILAMVLISDPNPPKWLIVTQMIFFVLSVCYFLLFGTIAELAVRVFKGTSKLEPSAKPASA